MISSLRDYLNQFVQLTDEEFRLLMSKLEACKFQKRELLTNTGEVENYLYFIERGLVKRCFLKNDEVIVSHIAKEGGIIGATPSFFSRQPSRYMVEALEPTTALRISHSNLEQLYTHSKTWEKLGRVITAGYLIQQEQILYDTTCLTVRQRFVKFMKENPDLILRVPQKLLASYLNIKQETFSRLKHLMTEKQPQI